LICGPFLDCVFVNRLQCAISRRPRKTPQRRIWVLINLSRARIRSSLYALIREITAHIFYCSFLCAA
jgi:hypothetical protein